MKLNNIFLSVIIFLFVTDRIAADSTIANPDPKRFQNEIEAFKNWDQKNSFPENAILFTGSSSIRMWKTHDAFPKYPLINRGFGGAHISDIIYYYDNIILKYNPKIIVFYCGDNDISSDIPVDQVYEDYLELISKITIDFPNIKFVFVSVKPSESRWKYWKNMDDLNKKIEKYNQEQENLFYIDLATSLLNKNGKPDTDLYLNDQLHLNERGYQMWNSILSKILELLYKNN